MADSVSLVAGDDEPGGDGMVLTDLANKLVARIPTLCTLKTFYDGMEKVPTKAFRSPRIRMVTLSISGSSVSAS